MNALPSHKYVIVTHGGNYRVTSLSWMVTCWYQLVISLKICWVQWVQNKKICVFSVFCNIYFIIGSASVNDPCLNCNGSGKSYCDLCDVCPWKRGRLHDYSIAHHCNSYSLSCYWTQAQQISLHLFLLLMEGMEGMRRWNWKGFLLVVSS